MSFTLIVPVAADKEIYSDNLPYLFSLDEDGIMLCVKSILGLNLSIFDNIYFTILKKHNRKFYLKDMFRIQFERLKLNNASIFILNEPTKSQAETIYKTITELSLNGSIFIKDADSYFHGEINRSNSVTIYPLDNLPLVDPRNKSYVIVDDMYYITNIIEKRILGRYFNAGGYCFEDTNEYCKYYQQLCNNSYIYISHIIYTMLLNKIVFRPIQVTEYIDWGTVELYKLHAYDKSHNNTASNRII